MSSFFAKLFSSNADDKASSPSKENKPSIEVETQKKDAGTWTKKGEEVKTPPTAEVNEKEEREKKAAVVATGSADNSKAISPKAPTTAEGSASSAIPQMSVPVANSPAASGKEAEEGDVSKKSGSKNKRGRGNRVNKRSTKSSIVDELIPPTSPEEEAEAALLRQEKDALEKELAALRREVKIAVESNLKAERENRQMVQTVAQLFSLSVGEPDPTAVLAAVNENFADPRGGQPQKQKGKHEPFNSNQVGKKGKVQENKALVKKTGKQQEQFAVRNLLRQSMTKEDLEKAMLKAESLGMKHEVSVAKKKMEQF